jgi:hypothetical protein
VKILRKIWTWLDADLRRMAAALFILETAFGLWLLLWLLPRILN